MRNVDPYFEELAREAQSAQDMLKAVYQESVKTQQALWRGDTGNARQHNRNVIEGCELLAKLFSVSLEA